MGEGPKISLPLCHCRFVISFQRLEWLSKDFVYKMGKTIYATRTIFVPEGVTVDFKSRVVTVSGPRGTLTRDFKHKSIDIQHAVKDDKKALKVDMWFATRETMASLRTMCSHIENMMTGVTKGFIYKMRFCYSHFPINVALAGKTVEIRNFLGERRVRRVELMDGVEYVRTADIKDQIEISGTDINKVSLACAQISQQCTVKNKDLRKFLDGIYVSQTGTISE